MKIQYSFADCLNLKKKKVRFAIRFGFCRGAFAALGLLAVTITTRAQTTYEPYYFGTFAGTAPGSADGTGSAARFNAPGGVAVDSAGNVYVADTASSTIRKITPAGVVTTFAGLAGSIGNADGTGSAARFNGPGGVGVDSADNVYVADSSNNIIRKITPAGVVSTFAGSGAIGNADGIGTAAEFNAPYSVAFDSSDNVYVADSGNHAIRKITPAGVVTTFAGSGVSGSADGTGTAAQFNGPSGVALDSANNVFVADSSNNTIRKITPGGDVTTFAGLAGTPPGGVDGTGSAARFSLPIGVAVDSANNVYVGDTNGTTIRKITPAGVVSTFAGVFALAGSADGTGSAARFNLPTGVAVDGSDNVYVADTNNCTIRRITPGAVVTTVAGSPSAGSVDGTGSAARFNFPQGVAVDGADNVFVADTNDSVIRKITPAGVVTTFAGLAGNAGSADGTGSAARFSFPRFVAADSAGNVYVADTANFTIRKITPAGVVSTLAGLAGSPGSLDGTGSGARFSGSRGIAVDQAGNLYVADQPRHTIRKVTPAGVVTTLAGLANNSGSDDGTGSAARFLFPTGVGVDASGNVFVSDNGNNTIRRITPAGDVSTLAGLAGSPGTDDGTGSAARFNFLSGVAVDSAGNVYAAEAGVHTIRKITPAGVVTTLAGLPGSPGTFDGAGSAARFNSPRGIGIDSVGNLYIGDSSNHTIRVSSPSAQWSATPASGDWNTAVNWTTNSLPPANGAAIFDQSNITNVSLSANAGVGQIHFNAGSSAYTITAPALLTLTIDGAGITNDSGVVQNFVASADASGQGFISFGSSASAGSLTMITNNASTVSGVGGGVTFFNQTSTAGNATVVNIGGTISGGNAGSVMLQNSATAGDSNFSNNGASDPTAGSGFTTFIDLSTGGSATFTNNPSEVSGAAGGVTFFNDTSSAGSAVINNLGPPITGGNGGGAFLQHNATAGNAIVTNYGSPASDAGNTSYTVLTGNATAGSAHFINKAGPADNTLGGVTLFDLDASGGSAVFVNEGAAFNGAGGGFMRFAGTSSAGTGTFITNGSAVSGGNGGQTNFVNSASAANGTFTTNGGTVSGGFQGFTQFFNTSTAGSGTFTNNPGVAGAIGGRTFFINSSSAGSASFHQNGGTAPTARGGTVRFNDSATADNATFVNDAGVSGGGDISEGFVLFTGSSSAANASFTNNGGAGVGGLTQFQGSATAANAMITSNGSTSSGLYFGGETDFLNTSTAGNATLIANSGSGTGASIYFLNDSLGGTCHVEIYGNGYLDLTYHNAPGVTIGSLAGSGNGFLGSLNLTVGSNNSSTTFSGVLQDGGEVPGGSGASLTKIGTGTLTLSGDSTYTGGTTVSGGVLNITGSVASRAGGRGFSIEQANAVGSVLVTNGGTLSGTGTINGDVTVDVGGAVDLSGGTLTVNGSVTNNGKFIFGNGAQVAGTTSFINNGTIYVTSGSFTPPPGFVNNGSVIEVNVAVAEKSGNTMTLTINSYTGHTYQLQKSSTPNGADFADIGASQPGSTGNVLTFTDSNATGASSFYRIAVDP